MFVTWVVAVGGFLIFGWLALLAPAEAERQRLAEGEVLAANFHNYRSAVITYLNANPSATGTIADASLTWPTGYIRNAAWSNVVSGGTLYTYSTSVPAPAVMDAIANLGGRTMMIGYKSASTTMTSMTGSATFTLPAAMSALPDGVVVIVGK